MENTNHYEVEKTCEVCGKTFMAKKINARFCSQRCQKRAFYRKRQSEEQERNEFYEEYAESNRRNMDRSYYGVLGGLFGVDNCGNEQEQMLTSLLAVQKDKIESRQSISLMKYQLEDLTKRFDALKAEYDTIRASVIDLQRENDKLTKENEELTEVNEKLSVESEANGNKVNQIGNIAGVALTQALMGLLPNTKFGKLMGLGEEEQVASSSIEEAPRPVVVPQEENFSVEPVYEAV